MPGHVFCRLTGSRIKANEEAVVRHARFKAVLRARFARMAKKNALLEEKDPATEAEERSESGCAGGALAVKRGGEGGEDEKVDGGEDEALRREEAAKRQLRFRENMGCWVPPHRDIESDESDESDEEDECSDAENAEEGAQNDLEDDFSTMREESSDALTKNLIATVQARARRNVVARLRDVRPIAFAPEIAPERRSSQYSFQV